MRVEEGGGMQWTEESGCGRRWRNAEDRGKWERKKVEECSGQRKVGVEEGEESRGQRKVGVEERGGRQKTEESGRGRRQRKAEDRRR